MKKHILDYRDESLSWEALSGTGNESEARKRDGQCI